MKKRRNRILCSIVLVIWIVSLGATHSFADGDTFTQDSFPVATATTVAELPNISAQAYALMDAHTGKLLVGKDEHEPLSMASTTKIMTALIALEQSNIDEYFTVDADAIKVEGSTMGLVEGDQANLRTLAYGMLLPSGNDAANAAAVRIAGTIEDFAVLMNEKAQALGMKDSSFVTPSGLDAEQHYSTAYDMALLAREALQNRDFAMICGATKAQVSFGSPPFPRWLSNHNRLLKYDENCIGVKTGFTKKSGRCLVSAAERDMGGRFIAVTLNAPNDWNDHQTLLAYGFDALQEKTLTPNIGALSLPIVGSDTQSVAITAVGEGRVTTVASPSDFTQRVVLRPFAYAPVQAGDYLGEIQFVAGGMVATSVPLIAEESAYIQQVTVKLSTVERVKELWGRFCGLFQKKEPSPLRS